MISAFLVLATLTIMSALGVVLSRSPVYSVLSLIFCLFTLAGHFFLLGSPFLAVIQVIVYAGAVMVLFLFTLMLMNLNTIERLTRSRCFRLVATFFAMLLAGVFFIGIQLSQNWLYTPINASTSVRDLGRALFESYIVPFEVSSVLFLVAVVAVVFLGKSQQGDA